MVVPSRHWLKVRPMLSWSAFTIGCQAVPEKKAAVPSKIPVWNSLLTFTSLPAAALWKRTKSNVDLVDQSINRRRRDTCDKRCVSETAQNRDESKRSCRFWKSHTRDNKALHERFSAFFSVRLARSQSRTQARLTSTPCKLCAQHTRQGHPRHP